MGPVKAAILGTGSYLPEKILTNADLTKIVDTSDEWITTRTGIKERHVAAENQTTSDLAVEAARRALDASGLKPADLDLILVATISPDTPTPSTACYVQAKLGAPQSAAFDLSAACSGFVYGLSVAKAFVESDQAKYVLVVGAEKLTAFVDWSDRATCVLFGDGAGAAVVGPCLNGRGEILSVHLSADGTQAELLRIPGGGSRCPTSAQSLANKQQYLKMAGKEVYKIAVKVMTDACQNALRRAGITLDQTALLIPHQANLRIIEAVRDRLDLPEEKVFVNIDRVGNTSAASVAIALDEAVRTNRLKPGDPVMLVAFGAGLTLAASVIRW